MNLKSISITFRESWHFLFLQQSSTCKISILETSATHRDPGTCLNHWGNPGPIHGTIVRIFTYMKTPKNQPKERKSTPPILPQLLQLSRFWKLRLTTIIRQIHIREGTAKAASVGALISNTFWPVIRQCLAQHPGDSKLVTCSTVQILGGGFKYFLCSSLFGEDSQFD